MEIWHFQSIQPNYLHRFRAHIALAFLLLFIRVMAPDDAILALHLHEHTEHALPDADIKVDTKHQHCHVDDSFNTEFDVPGFSLRLVNNPAEACYLQLYNFAWKFTYPNNIYLRGPPAA